MTERAETKALDPFKALRLLLSGGEGVVDPDDVRFMLDVAEATYRNVARCAELVVRMNYYDIDEDGRETDYGAYVPVAKQDCEALAQVLGLQHPIRFPVGESLV